MTSEEFTARLARTKIKLGVSPIHGIGVFALVDIPAGTQGLFSPPAVWRAVPLTELDVLAPVVRQHVETYCLQDETNIYLPPHGLEVMDLVMYLNHSDTPNLQQLDGGSDFRTLRDVDAGEELLIDYGMLEV
jgi:SET domain-containing protein